MIVGKKERQDKKRNKHDHKLQVSKNTALSGNRKKEGITRRSHISRVVQRVKFREI